MSRLTRAVTSGGKRTAQDDDHEVKENHRATPSFLPLCRLREHPLREVTLHLTAGGPSSSDELVQLMAPAWPAGGHRRLGGARRLATRGHGSQAEIRASRPVSTGSPSSDTSPGAGPPRAPRSARQRPSPPPSWHGPTDPPVAQRVVSRLTSFASITTAIEKRRCATPRLAMVDRPLPDTTPPNAACVGYTEHYRPGPP